MTMRVESIMDAITDKAREKLPQPANWTIFFNEETGEPLSVVRANPRDGIATHNADLKCIISSGFYSGVAHSTLLKARKQWEKATAEKRALAAAVKPAIRRRAN